MKSIVCGVLIAALVNCGCEAKGKSEPVAIDQVPKNLIEIAKEKLPDVTFDQAVRKSNGVLEIRGKNKQGKVRDIEFSKTGEIVEIE